MNVKPQLWMIAAGILGAAGIALGAVAAHAVTDPAAVSALERATIYQILHAIALLALAGCGLRWMGVARFMMLVGTLVFCGSIYAKYLLGLSNLGKLAPMGGMALIISWLLVTVSAATRQINGAPASSSAND